MPRVERNIEINAPQKDIFNILNNTMIGPKWNLAVNEVTKISEPFFDNSQYLSFFYLFINWPHMVMAFENLNVKSF